MIAPSDFSLAGGELTPTMKMKRHFIEVSLLLWIKKIHLKLPLKGGGGRLYVYYFRGLVRLD